jgi:hypothetical protein
VGAPSAPVKAYLDHLSDISENDPVLLVAHAYTQQMALLAGGQRISKFISSTLPRVSGDEGVSVFAFTVRLSSPCKCAAPYKCPHIPNGSVRTPIGNVHVRSRSCKGLGYCYMLMYRSRCHN